MAESEEELKSLLRVKEESEKEESKKADLKPNFRKAKIMASNANHFIANKRGKRETMVDFISLGSKITADGDCSHKIKWHLLLGRKAMTNLDSVLKSRDINLPTKVHIVKAMAFSIVMYGCESWTIKEGSSEELMLLNCGAGEDS